MIGSVKKAVRLAVALKTAFKASANYAPFTHVMDSATNFINRIDRFAEEIKKEDTHASLLFAQNCIYVMLDAVKNRPVDWQDYFQILEYGLAKTQEEIAALDEQSELESLGRIQYKVKILEQYYKAHDKPIFPVLDAFGRVNSVDVEIYDLLPSGSHVMKHNGHVFTLNIS